MSLLPSEKLRGAKLLAGYESAYECAVFQELKGISGDHAQFVLEVVAAQINLPPEKRQPILFFSQKFHHMHELAVTQSILDISLRYAQKVNAKQIVSIHLVIGKFSSVVDDSVQFYWDTIAEGTIAQGAKLRFERIPAEMTCRDCGFIFEPTDETFACPQCLSPKVKISKGEELRVESIDIE